MLNKKILIKKQDLSKLKTDISQVKAQHTSNDSVALCMRWIGGAAITIALDVIANVISSFLID